MSPTDPAPESDGAIKRAYAVLEIKAVHDDERIIEGIASTPTPDRIGDIVEPLGAKFKIPMPLLWQHRSGEPVGQVTFAKPGKEGIPFKARFAAIEEPGRLRERLDEAWQSVKIGLVRAVSIGFRSLEHSVMENGGWRFIEWEWLELSLVTIPANQDATITTIRSIDAELRAAEGRGAADPTPEGSDNASPAKAGARAVGADGTRSSRPRVSIGSNSHREERSMSKKTLAEQIREFEATRQAKAARMAEIMEKSAEDGETLDDEQTEEYDGLKGEVKSIDDHLVRLRDLETINAAAAKPVGEVKTLEDGAAARGGNGRVSVRAAALPPGIRFARVVKCLGMAKGHLGEAVHLAEHHYSDDQPVVGVLKGAQRVGKLDQDMITRAAVGAMASSHAQGGGALISDESGVFADFVEFLRAMTILGRFGTGDYPSLRRVPFRTPLISQTSGGDAYWTGEGMGKGLTNFDFERTTLEPLKAANICVVTEEVLRDSSPSADMLVRDSLASALRERLDIDFINPNKTAVANISPAGITNGVTAIASSGTDADAVRADIGALLAAFVAANNPPTDGVLIMTSIRAMNLSLMRNALGQKEFPDITLRGGMLEGLPVMTSQYVPDTGSPAFSYVILVNASDVYFADEGGIAIDMSREASLQMDSAPTMTAHGAGSPGTATATSVVSLWQTNTVGFRAERTVNWARRRASGVQVLSGVAWRPTVA